MSLEKPDEKGGGIHAGGKTGSTGGNRTAGGGNRLFSALHGRRKGKTTAAFGLALRAAMAGRQVYIGQFVKSMEYHEAKCPLFIPNIEVHQYGTGCIFGREPNSHDVACAEAGLKEAAEVLAGGKYDLVILDELNVALYLDLLRLQDAVEAIRNRAKHVEVVATGRYAPQALIDMADLVTEMREVRHYYQKGVPARDGIER
jgi:cob(I)alamin adenosyltransferase